MLRNATLSKIFEIIFFVKIHKLLCHIDLVWISSVRRAPHLLRKQSISQALASAFACFLIVSFSLWI